MKKTFPRKELIWYLGNIIVPLVGGAVIYLRSGNGTYFHDLLKLFHFDCSACMVQEGSAWLRNWGCDFLWAYALFFSALMIDQNHINAVLIGSTCAIVLECLQLVQIEWLRCGYFDFLDILVEVLAICIGCAVAQLYILITIRRREKNEHGKQHQ